MELLRTTPDVTIRSLSLAIYHVLSCAETGTQAIHKLPLVIARLSNFTPISPLKDLRANLFGRFVAVQGTVVRVSDVRPLVTHLHFVCESCGQDVAHALKDGRYAVPAPCCGNAMTPNHAGPLTRTIDLQKVTSLISRYFVGPSCKPIFPNQESRKLQLKSISPLIYYLNSRKITTFLLEFAGPFARGSLGGR